VTRRRDDTGASLVDLLVASVVLTVLLTTVGLALVAMIRASGRLEATARSSTQARSVVDTLTRSLGRAAEVNPPTSLGPATYLEARTDAVPDGGAPFCTQWRVRADAADLAVRTWTAGTTDATGWTTVATDVTVPAGTAAFTVLPADGGWRYARVGVDVRVQGGGGASVPVQAVVALVNGTSGTGGVAQDAVCTEVPPS
jgi:hypothetical protein